jgi:hypothetical protein
LQLVFAKKEGARVVKVILPAVVLAQAPANGPVVGAAPTRRAGGVPIRNNAHPLNDASAVQIFPVAVDNVSHVLIS